MLSSAEYEAEWKWMRAPEAAKRSAAAKAEALSYFKQRFPNADMENFKVQVTFDKKRKALGEVLFKEGDGSSISVFDSDRKYWSQAMISALGLHHDGGFPFQLTPNNLTLRPIPAIDQAETIDPTQLVGELLNKKQKIYVRPTDYLPCSSGRFSRTRRSHSKQQICQKLARRAKHGLLAPAIKLRAVVCNNRLRYFA